MQSEEAAAGAALDRAGLVRDGEPEQPHVYPWSTAFRLPVRGGAVWLKSVGPGSAHEPPLSGALGGWVPEHARRPARRQRRRRGGPAPADSVPGWTAERLEPGTLTAAPAGV